MNFTLGDLALFSGGVMSGSDRALSQAVTDSRKAFPGSVFFALRGSRADGHEFVSGALALGAAAVVSRGEALEGTVRVASVEKALLDCASGMRSRMEFPVVAVTGSSGKTTTREMIRLALSPRYRAGASPGNLNNSIGLPLSLLNLDPSCDAAVVELGMNAPGELTLLGGIARPDVTVITNIGTAHIEFLGSREGIAAAKAELLAQTAEGGLCVIPSGEPLLDEAAASRGLRILRHGPGGDAWLDSSGPVPVAMPWGLPVRLRMPGLHNCGNAVCAALTASGLGIPAGRALEALSSLEPLEGRGSVFEAGRFRVIDESYNANPESMRACLSTLAGMPGNKAAVLGDMLELGPRSAAEHEELLRSADLLGLTALVLVGDGMASASPAASRTRVLLAHDWQGALEQLGRIGGELTLLVKGSHSIGLESLVEALRTEGKCCTGCCIR
jgi:UDP-N-acetylmuramoyl-tripeptide--D-alanyl-D-alanine ligase